MLILCCMKFCAKNGSCLKQVFAFCNMEILALPENFPLRVD